MNSVDTIEAGQQTVLPGAERANDATMAKRRAAAPLKPATPQAPCDLGLFSHSRNQLDLLWRKP